MSDLTDHDESTLDKVRAGLRAFNPFLDEQSVTDFIASIQNQGILFRERAENVDPKQITDGFHTMEELYDHRRALTAALAAERADISWRSTHHHPDDSPMFEGGYFIVGIDTPHGTITYHYKLSHWDDFAEVPEVEHAPKWDGAAPEDTVTRLLTWAREGEQVSLQMTAPVQVITQIGDDPDRTRTDVWS